jgi:flagellin-like protein
MKIRKGISPVLATVILIAITLIAAIAIAGFVFGLFGTFQNPPQISANSSLAASNGPTGTITLYNSGTSSAMIQSVSLTYNGQSCDSLMLSTGSVPSGQSTAIQIQPGTFSPGSSTYQCGQQGTTSVPTAGTTYTGIVVINGGYDIPFTGTFH